ncbi:hypothetical protein R1flu_018216 [Riccia fluitans]|uniref:Uncharacterized protein n=1 Tax=Riccia fluitans TaxID=41844 RepID=A0ABD1ZFD9_9MARC
MAIDDSEIPSAEEREHRMTGKRKRAVGENIHFLVSGISSGLKESMDTLATAMKDCEKMRAESEDKQNAIMAQNCDKICEVIKFLATAVQGINSRAGT